MYWENKKRRQLSHSKSTVCTIEDISAENKNKIMDNIKILEDLSQKKTNWLIC